MTETTSEILTAQIGNRNTMSIKFGKQMDAPFFIEQIGNKNKMIIQLDDRRQSEQLELQSTGEGQLVQHLYYNLHPHTHPPCNKETVFYHSTCILSTIILYLLSFMGELIIPIWYIILRSQFLMPVDR